MKKIKYLLDYFKYLENPQSALRFKFGFTKECEIKIKHYNNQIHLDSITALNRLTSLLTI